MFSNIAIVETLHDGPRVRVVRAVRQHDQRPVVVKIAATSVQLSSAAAALQREFKLMQSVARMQSPCLPLPLGLLEEEGWLGLMMDDVGGTNLRRVLREGPLPWVEIARIGLEVARALGALHQARVVHKDVNPNNIICNRQSGRVQLVDLSIATALTGTTRDAASLRALEGTPAYLSPEQTGRTQHALDTRSDFFSLGVTLYEMLTGNVPFAQAEISELLYAILATRPTPPHQLNSAAPVALCNIVERLMEKEPALRYQSAHGLAADLQRSIVMMQTSQARVHFALGSQDRIERFELPAQIYGRAAEEEILRDTLVAALANEHTQAVLLEGPAGAGKSALAATLRSPAAAVGAWYARGVFTSAPAQPFAAVGQALGGILRALLSESESSLDVWRRRLQATVGSSGAALAVVVPELERLLGKQPPSPDLPLREAENRLLALLQRCIITLCKERPLVLVLDGMQWADSGARKLVETLSHEAEMGAGLCLLLTDQDSHNHERTLQAPGAQRLKVPALSLDSVCQLIAEAMRRAPDVCLPLAQAMHTLTSGNPRFLRSVLQSLWDQEFITYDTRSGSFDCDMGALATARLPDSLGHLLASRLGALTVDEAAALSLAACAGSVVDGRVLSEASGMPLPTMLAALHVCRQAALLTPDTQDAQTAPDAPPLCYTFTHEHVRQAALELLAPEQLSGHHHALGMALWRRFEAGAGDALTVVQHLNHAIEWVTQPEERQGLAALNLRAASQARQAAAPAQVHACLHMALQLWPEESRAVQRPAHRQMLLDLAYNESLGGATEAALQRLDSLAQSAQGPLEIAQVQTLRTTLYSDAGRYAEAIKICVEGLRTLGYNFRLGSPLGALWLGASAAVRGRWTSIERLATAPPCTDPRAAAALALLGAGAGAAYFLDAVTCINLLMRIVLLSMRYGPGPNSAFAYAMYSSFLATSNRYELARSYARLARDMASRGDPAQTARVTFSYTGWMGHIEASPVELLSESEAALSTARNFGDTFYVAANTMAVQTFRLQTPHGVDLTVNSESLDLPAATAANQRALVLLTRQTVRCLNGRTRGLTRLDDDSCSEADLRGHMSTEPMFQWRTLMVALLHRDIPLACSTAERLAGQQHFLALPDGTLGSLCLYAALALVQEAALAKRKRVRRPNLLRITRSKLRHIARAAPSLHAGEILLVDAEYAALRGNNAEAVRLYDLACMHLSRSGWFDRRALAWECAGRFYLRNNMTQVAEVYLRKARDAYATWGARVKVGQLDETLRERFGNPMQSTTRVLPGLQEATVHLSGRHATSSGETPSAHNIDMPALMQVARAISGEVQLDRLVERVLDGLRKCTGATRVVLLLPNAGDFRAVADTAGSEPGAPPQLPVQMFQFVARSLQALVLHDLTNPEVPDPYFNSTKARALMCAPIMRQDLLRGLVYLESDINANAFDTQQVTVVEVLAAQAAIALENADTYAHLEREVSKRTAEVKAAHAQLLQLERDSTELQMAGGFAHEMRNALSSARMCLDCLMRTHLGESPEAGTPTVRASVLENLQALNTAAQSLQNPQLKALVQGMRSDRDQSDELLDTIRLGLDHGMDITRNILDYAQVGHIVPGDDRVSARSVVDEVLTDLRLSAEASIAIDVQVPPHAPIAVRQEHAYAMLRNLLANARDAVRSTPQHTGRISVNVEQAADSVVVRVRDNGVGMSAQTQARIFQPFFSTKGARGTGLGLGFSRKLARVYGGDLTFTSAPSEGTVFELRLPRVD